MKRVSHNLSCGEGRGCVSILAGRRGRTYHGASLADRSRDCWLAHRRQYCRAVPHGSSTIPPVAAPGLIFVFRSVDSYASVLYSCRVASDFRSDRFYPIFLSHLSSYILPSAAVGEDRLIHQERMSCKRNIRARDRASTTKSRC